MTLPQPLSHSAALPEWLEEPLSHSARVAGAATQPISHSARVAGAATLPEWLEQPVPSHSAHQPRSGWSSHSATLAEWLEEPLSHSATLQEWLEQPLSHSATLPERLEEPLSHSATLPEWLEQPLSHSARVAGAATQPLRVAEWLGCLSGWGENFRHCAFNLIRWSWKRQSQLNFKVVLKKKRIDKKAFRMNYLHLFNVHVLFLHPSAFRYARPPNSSSWPRPSPQLHLTLSPPSLLTPLHTFCP